MAAKEIGEYFIKEIRKDLEKVYPKLKEYLEKNKPELFERKKERRSRMRML